MQGIVTGAGQNGEPRVREQFDELPVRVADHRRLLGHRVVDYRSPEAVDHHLALRRALTPFFSTGAVEKMRPFMEQSVHWFLDQRIADGQMDLVLDYASPVPAILTMRLMGLPYDNWQLYADLFHSVMAASGGDEYNKAIAEVPAMLDGLLKFVAARRADPGDDLTSFLVQFEFDGKRLDDTQLLDILWNLIGGGVDTTTSLTALSLLHLGTHPDLRQQLIDQPELYRTAADEFLRYFSVNKQLSRTVSRDTVLCGQQLRRNDQCSSAGSAPTTTSASSSDPTRWCWTARPTATSRSGSGRTAASALRWRASCSR